MAVKIRLKRVGMRNTPIHRIVVADGRKPRDGRNIEELGTYWPLNDGPENFKLNLERAEYWLGVGAQASDTVRSIISKARRVAKGETLPEAKPKKKAEPPKEEVKEEEAPAATEEKPVEEQAAEETPADEPAAEAATEESSEEAPAEEAKAEEPAAEEESTEESKDDDAPAEEAAADDAEEKSEDKSEDKPAE